MDNFIKLSKKAELINGHISQSYTKEDVKHFPETRQFPHPEMVEITVNVKGVEKLLLDQGSRESSLNKGKTDNITEILCEMKLETQKIRDHV